MSGETRTNGRRVIVGAVAAVVVGLAGTACDVETEPGDTGGVTTGGTTTGGTTTGGATTGGTPATPGG